MFASKLALAAIFFSAATLAQAAGVWVSCNRDQ
jgi:hypothetical protein